MKTILIDKNYNVINEGDILKVKANLAEYPGLYHYGMYKVSFDHIRGMILTFVDLVLTNDTNNQLIGTYEFRINEHIQLWRHDSDSEIIYCRFNIGGNTFVKIDPTNDIEKVL
jgi:hypothetical protein